MRDSIDAYASVATLYDQSNSTIGPKLGGGRSASGDRFERKGPLVGRCDSGRVTLPSRSSDVHTIKARL